MNLIVAVACPKHSFKYNKCGIYVQCCSFSQKTLICSIPSIFQMCLNNHVLHRWSSQPRLSKRGNHLGDFMFALNTLLSGNNHAKIALFMKFMGLKPLSKYCFFQVQANLTVPVIQNFWKKTQDSMLSDLRGKELVVAGKMKQKHVQLEINSSLILGYPFNWKNV